MFVLMKKYIFSVTFFALSAILFYACKEEEIGNQQFVQNYMVGKWPHKTTILKTIKNGTTILDSTIIYGLDTPNIVLPIDTVQFAADGKCIKNGEALNYTIDDTGDNITYSVDSLGTWKIKFLRLKSIILTQEKTEKKGSDTFIYYKEEQLIK